MERIAVGIPVKIEPVTVHSPPQRIVENFELCGYFLQLSADLEAQARAGPVEWLRGHPYLYAWYPQFFVDVTRKVKSDEATVKAAYKRPISD